MALGSNAFDAAGTDACRACVMGGVVVDWVTGKLCFKGDCDVDVGTVVVSDLLIGVVCLTFDE